LSVTRKLDNGVEINNHFLFPNASISEEKSQFLKYYGFIKLMYIVARTNSIIYVDAERTSIDGGEEVILTCQS